MASHRLKHSGQRSMTNMKSEMKYYNTLILMNGVFHDINISEQSMTVNHREVSFEIRISQSQKKPIPEEIGKMESLRANVSPLKPVLLSDGNNGNFIQVFHRKRAKVRDPKSIFNSLRFFG